MAFEKLKNINLIELAEVASFSNVRETVAWLQSLNLLASKPKCSKCNGELTIRNKSSLTDGMTWRCLNGDCRSSTSIRKHSFFEHRSITFEAMLTAIYFWSKECSLESIEHESRLSHSAIVPTCQLLRKVLLLIYCSLYKNLEELEAAKCRLEGKLETVDTPCLVYAVCSVELQCCDLIGGPGHNVAIDGYFVSRGECRKRSKPSPTEFWVISGVDLQTKECFMCMADDRNESTMVDIIEQNVAHGSNIYWQKWGSELQFGDQELQQYSFHIINSKKQIKGITGTRINDLHSLWNSWKIKEESKQFTALKMIPDYMDEFIWRHKRPQGHVFADILEAISRHYVGMPLQVLSVESELKSEASLTNSDGADATPVKNSLVGLKVTDCASVKNTTLNLEDIKDTTVTKDYPVIANDSNVCIPGRCSSTPCSCDAAVSIGNPLGGTGTTTTGANNFLSGTTTVNTEETLDILVVDIAEMVEIPQIL